MHDIKQQTAILIIGDEVLSGRTVDTNSGWLAGRLGALGLPVGEIRVVPDVMAEIISAVNTLRARYKYLFTCGGIGPTHDDITADGVAAAFGVKLAIHPQARTVLAEHVGEANLNESRLRMARIPDGGTLIDNPISRAPGIQIGNVYVMAGVPKIMQAMFDGVAPTLEGGTPILMRTIATSLKEGDFGTQLGELQQHWTDVSFGSYPRLIDGTSKFTTQIVAKGMDTAQLDAAVQAVLAMLVELGDSAAGAARHLVTRHEAVQPHQCDDDRQP